MELSKDELDDLIEKVRKKKNEIEQIDIKLHDLQQKKKNSFAQLLEIQNQVNELEKQNIKSQNDNKKTKFSSYEQISKLFSDIQHKLKLTLHEKHKIKSYEILLGQQKKLIVSYLIIQKLEIKEEFYTKNKIKESQNLFENLEALENKGLLNYASLKGCGPQLLYRIIKSSKVEDLKTDACWKWNLPQESFSLYDDVWANLDVILSSNVQKLFSIYQPTDSTLPPGHTCFYLVEKLKNQKSLLNAQQRALNKDNLEDNQQGGGILMGEELDNCIQKLNEGKILKGINKYHPETYEEDKEFENFVNIADNNIIFIVLTLILIIISFIAVSGKIKNIIKWSQITQKNALFLSNAINIDQNNNFNSFLTSFENIFKDHDISNYGFTYYGYQQFRFFYTKEKKCFHKDVENTPLNKNYFYIIKEKCYYSDHSKNHKNKDVNLNLLGIKYSSDLKIKHYYQTYTGNFDESGVSLRFTKGNMSDTIEKLQKNNDEILNEKGLQGFEVAMNLYDPNLDVFITNVFLIQQEINNAFVSQMESIPFLSNVYEKNRGIYICDILRLVISLILFLFIILQIVFKYRSLKSKSFKKLLVTIMNTLLKIKNLLIIISTVFLIAAFVIFNDKNINSQKYYEKVENGTAEYIDFYYYAYKQNNARYLDQISFVIIFFYFFKFLQVFSSINRFIICLKKTAFEIFLIFIIILLLLLGMSCMTNFIYGGYIKKYSTFGYSMITNIQLIMFIENTGIINELMVYFKSFSICFFLFFILVIRLFLLNLINPIIIEYMRVEEDKVKQEKENKKTWRQKFMSVICSFFNIKKNFMNPTDTEPEREVNKFEIDDLIRN